MQQTESTTKVVTTGTGVRHISTKGELEFSRIFINGFQKPGTKTLEVKQVVTTESFYPSKKTTSNMQEGLFDNSEFGFGEQRFVSPETRVAWILIPVATTEEQAMERLNAAKAKGACIYRVLSNEPIIDENQKYAIGQGLKSYDDFANSQVSKYPENDEQGRGGQLILDRAGKVQYRRTFFWNTPRADEDLRGNGKEYMSPEIEALLLGASVMEGQII